LKSSQSDPALPPERQPLPSDLAADLAHAAPRLGPFAARVIWYDEVTSTNDIAVALADRGEHEGTVILADVQRAGRGRLGRRWASPPGAGLYLSVILRPPSPDLLTLAAGVGVADGLQRATGLVIDLKWPNDLYVGDRKIAGILAEGGATRNGRSVVVLGVGVNILTAVYPADIADRATSIEAELGRPIERGVVLVETLAGLYAAYTAVVQERGAEVLQAWRALARRWLGRQVQFHDMGMERRGVALDIDQTGALVINTSTGLHRVIAGEVTWR
jgi:BirA family biotin operon repressor/biotin-[acetyl-CoA-carboxylase] ligase